MEVLFDTCSSFTICSERFFKGLKNLEPDLKICYEPYALSNLTTEDISIAHYFNGIIKIGEFVFEHPVRIVQGSWQLSKPAVLGIDFIRRFGLNYSGKDGSIYWNEKPLILSNNVIMVNTTQFKIKKFPLRLATDYVLEPRSISFVSIDLNKHMPSVKGV